MKNNIVNNKNYERLIKEFHPTKNEELKLSDFNQGSHKKVWWKCHKADDHEWNAIIKDRTRGVGCPCCAGKKIVSSNCLATTHPEIAKQWHPTKNDNFTAFDIPSGSKKAVWWKCDKVNDHEWKSNVHERTRGKNCPYCCGKKTSLSNCLATTHPEIAKQWHPTKNNNLTPFDVTFGSGKKIWWKCDKTHTHEWNAVLNNRTTNCSKCPYCYESKGENKIKSILEDRFIKYQIQKRFDDCKYINTLPFDIYLTNYNALIEYDGILHYKPIDFMGGKKALEGTKIRDKIKTEYAMNNNIPLLRIPYTQFDNIENIIVKFIKKINNKMII